MRASQRPDPVRLEVFHHLLAAVCEEGGAVLQRSAISPNIRERRDFSFALFDRDGRLVAQAAHIPVHLGSAGDSVLAVRRALELEPGDVAILNDPYDGGTHLPDITLVRPVFFGREKRAAFYLVDRAHHADIGGAHPGSMGIALDLHGEGLAIPPVKLRVRGKPARDVLALLGANVRGPDERLVDLRAQEAALELGERRLRALCDEQGRREVERYATHLMDYSAKIAASVVRAMPDGTYGASDALEDDGCGNGPFPIRVRITVRGKHLRFDWRGSAPQARGGINANRSIVTAASVYVLRCLCPERLPTNDGLLRALEIVTEPGSLLDPVRPAPVAGGNVETSQRLVDVALKALARVLPVKIPAASAGTMSNLTLGGTGADGSAFSIYETLPGGAGATPQHAGTSAVQTHMTNTRNTPVEELERRYPLLVRELTVRRGSGGRGKRRGGDGIVKEIEARAEASVALFADRHRSGPPGLAGGGAGAPGRAVIVRKGGKRERLASKASAQLAPGDAVRIETPGGGGHGAR